MGRYLGTLSRHWGHWADIGQILGRHWADKNLTECTEKEKAHTKTAPEFVVKNSLPWALCNRRVGHWTIRPQKHDFKQSICIYQQKKDKEIPAGSRWPSLAA